MDYTVFNKWVDILFNGYFGAFLCFSFAVILLYEAKVHDRKCMQKVIWAAFSVALGIVFFWDQAFDHPGLYARAWFRMMFAFFLASAFLYKFDTFLDMGSWVKGVLRRGREREPS